MFSTSTLKDSFSPSNSAILQFRLLISCCKDSTSLIFSIDTVTRWRFYLKSWSIFQFLSAVFFCSYPNRVRSFCREELRVVSSSICCFRDFICLVFWARVFQSSWWESLQPRRVQSYSFQVATVPFNSPISTSLSSRRPWHFLRSLSTCVNLLCDNSLELKSIFRFSLISIKSFTLFSNSTLIELTLLNLISNSGICSALRLITRYFSLISSSFFSLSCNRLSALSFYSTILGSSLESMLIFPQYSWFFAMNSSILALFSARILSFCRQSSPRVSIWSQIYLIWELVSSWDNQYRLISFFWLQCSLFRLSSSQIKDSLSFRMRFRDQFSDFKMEQDSFKALSSIILLLSSWIWKYLDSLFSLRLSLGSLDLSFVSLGKSMAPGIESLLLPLSELWWQVLFEMLRFPIHWFSFQNSVKARTEWSIEFQAMTVRILKMFIIFDFY